MRRSIRADGAQAYPKAISWFDPATAEIHMTVVLLEKGEGKGVSIGSEGEDFIVEPFETELQEAV